MIVDSHCHAWTYWPYQPEVPDPESRGLVEQLLHEMDRHGVDRAAVVCAQIEHNPENNAYIADAVQRYPDRLYQLADVDSSWSDTYHTPGAADRLRSVAERWPIKGFTHYFKGEDDGAWLLSEDGLAFFQVAEEKRLIASLACRPHHHKFIRQIAQRFPSVPILIHHLGSVKVAAPPEEGLNEVLASAAVPNIYIKLSGFYYGTSGPAWDFPYRDTHAIVRAEYEHFGGGRMCWGSDYPVVRKAMTYEQAIEAFRTHCDFIDEADHPAILGETLYGLLEAAGGV